jgi:hypothetical protein
VSEHFIDNKKNTDSDIIIWDSLDSPGDARHKIVLWRGFCDALTRNSFSLPKFIEDNSDLFRSRYLSWIHELGETSVNDRSLL